MEKKLCSHVVNELKELLGEDVASEIICGFLHASDKELMDIRNALEPLLVRRAVAAR